MNKLKKKWFEKDKVEKSLDITMNEIISSSIKQNIINKLELIKNNLEEKVDIKLKLNIEFINKIISSLINSDYKDFKNIICDDKNIIFLSNENSFGIGFKKIQFLNSTRHGSWFSKPINYKLNYDTNFKEDWENIDNQIERRKRIELWVSSNIYIKILNDSTINFQSLDPSNDMRRFYYNSKGKYYTKEGYLKCIDHEFDIQLNDEIIKLLLRINIIYDILEDIKSMLINFIEKEIEKYENEIEKNEVKSKKEIILNKFPKNEKNEPTIIEIDSFFKLIETNEQIIKNIDLNYLQKFIRLSNHLNQKRKWLIDVITKINEIEKYDEFEEYIEILEDENNVLNQLLVYSINMLVSLVENKMILFFIIFEKFEQLGIFQSKWENDIKEQLSEINSNLIEMINSIHQMESNLRYELDKLGNDIDSSIVNLKKEVNNQLMNIDSSLKYNNLLTTINTYQTFKINKRIK